MLSTTTLIIGAGQCGLAMSRELSAKSIDHIVTDAGQAGESWRSRRWDSLRLLTPNWMNGLAGDERPAPDPNGFMTSAAFAAGFPEHVARHNLPLLEHTEVQALERCGDGYIARTSQGPIMAQTAVIASGACARAKVPGFAKDLPDRVAQISPIDYRRPSDLSGGDVLVVGASASGLQLARELALSGRRVTVSVGNHGRMPRSYRGADILLWMDRIGAFDEPFTEVDDLERVRRTPSLPLIGSPTGDTIDLNALQDIGVEIVGRTADIRDGSVLFSGGLSNVCASADLKMNRLLDRIDDWIRARGLDADVPPARRFEPTRLPSDPRLALSVDGFDTVIWATGFSPDHDFVKMPVFDRKGRIRHQGGVVEPGLCVMGLPFLRTYRSVHIDGAPRDAQALSQDIVQSLEMPRAA